MSHFLPKIQLDANICLLSIYYSYLHFSAQNLPISTQNHIISAYFPFYYKKMPILSDPQGRQCPKKHFDLVLLYINIFHLYIQYLLYVNHSNICNLLSKPYNIALKSPIIVTFFKFILFNLIRIPHT